MITEVPVKEVATSLNFQIFQSKDLLMRVLPIVPILVGSAVKTCFLVIRK